MNPVFKIIDFLLITINRVLDKLDHRTVSTIKNAFYLVVAIAVVIGILIGSSNGKKAARRTGKPLVAATDNLFEISLRKELGRKAFRSLVEAEKADELKNSELNKVELPENVNNKPEFDNSIIEDDSGRKIKKSVQQDKNELADINPGTDLLTERDYSKPELKKTDANANEFKKDILIKKEPPKPIFNNTDIIE